MVIAMRMNGMRNGKVMWRNAWKALQPSTRAASIGSLGIASSPASSRIAKIDDDIQISATPMDMLASTGWTRNAIGSRTIPSVMSALFTKPTLSLRRYLNWKPTSIGENIIGNMMMQRISRLPKVTWLTSSARPRPISNSAFKTTVKKSSVRPNAHQKSASVSSRS